MNDEELVEVDSNVVEEEEPEKLGFFGRVTHNAKKHWRKIVVGTAIGVSGCALGCYLTAKAVEKDGAEFYDNLEDGDKETLDNMIKAQEEKSE